MFFFQICLGSGLKGYGISICLEMITSYLPSPLYTQQMIPSALDKLCGIVYKATLDPSRGLLCQARIYSGEILFYADFKKTRLTLYFF